MMILLLILAQLAGTPPPLVSMEASRLSERAFARRAEPNSAVDLIRLSSLGDWLPSGVFTKSLKTFSADPTGHPLSRAVADWLLYERAHRYLDLGEAAAARKRLGLLNRFVFRPGRAPHGLAVYDKSKWRPYPAKESTGLIRLDAVISTRSHQIGTLITDIHVKTSGPAVLRMGYDDLATVWLNGDEIFRAREAHDAWLDQHAVSVYLRAGPNRLMVQAHRTQGRWAFLGRLTTPSGEPIEYTHDYPKKTKVPQPADGPLIEGVITLWDELSKTLKVDPPQIGPLTDLAWYAQHAHLPNRDQTLIQVALSGAFDKEESPSVLRAWLAILSAERRAAKRRLIHTLRGSTEDTYDLLRLTLDEAWAHFYARRMDLAWQIGKRLRQQFPQVQPVQRLWSVLHEDVGFNQTAVTIAKALAPPGQGTIGAQRLLASTLQSAGRVHEEQAHLRAMIEAGEATTDERLRLAHIYARRGAYRDAIAVIDDLTSGQVWAWPHQFLAVDILKDSGQGMAARRRLEGLYRDHPSHPEVIYRLANLYLDDGMVSKAETLARSLAPDVIDENVDRLKRRFKSLKKRPTLGPPLTDMKRQACTTDPAIVLYHHARTNVSKSGLASRWVRRVLQICDQIGVERYSKIDIQHAPGTQSLTIPVARRVRENAWLTAERSERSLSDPENRLFFDLRAETLKFSGTKPGDLIEVVWNLKDVMAHPATPGEYGETAFLQEEIPRIESVVEFGGTGASRIHVGVVAHGLNVRRSGQKIQTRNVPGVRMSADGPGWTDRLAYVHFSTQSQWTSVDKAYQKLLGQRGRISPQLAAIAAEQTKESTDDRDRIARLYNLVADRVRYVGLETGVHSFQPAYPEQTYARGYGDCKDKAILLITLLRSVGIDSRFALIRTRAAGTITRKPASLSVFDHAMVYLPALDRFIDPTVENNAVWTLPTEDQGATALVIGEGKLRQVPFASLHEQKEVWTLQLVWNAKGLSGKAHLSAHGQSGTRVRRIIEPKTDRIRQSNALLRTVLPDYSFQRIKADGLRPAVDPVVLHGPIRTANLGSRQAQRPRPISIGLNDWKLVQTWAPTAQRSAPLNIPHRYSRTVRYTLDVPQEYAVSAGENVDILSPFGRFQIRIRTIDHRLSVDVILERSATHVSVQEYPKYRRWLSQIDGALTHSIEVSRDAL